MGRRIMENYILVWLDAHIDESKESFRHSYAHLQSIISSIDIYTDPVLCAENLSKIAEAKIFMIISGHLSKTFIPSIHHLPLLDSIYIDAEDTRPFETFKDQWFKVKGIFDQIGLIYDALQEATHLCDHNSVTVSFLPKTETSLEQNRIQIDPTFLYTQLLKETLLTIDFEDEQFIQAFAKFSYDRYPDNPAEVKKIQMFENEYHDHTPIWWYTYECSFLYRALNKALGHLEIDTLLKMGFFIQHLHQHIVKLHEEQQAQVDDKNTQYFVYRGQGLSKTDFEKLQSTEGGLMSFNNFLSTSQEKKVAMEFIERVRRKADKIPILFVIEIDRNLFGTGSSPFASVDAVSCFEAEREILFSMNSVFRIDEIREMDEENKGLWQVKLILTTSDSDIEYAALIHQLREENTGTTGWTRLGQLLIKLGRYDRAAELYMALIGTTNDEKWLVCYYYMLGLVFFAQGKYQDALALYNQATILYEKDIAANLSDLASTYNNVGLIYCTIGDYPTALTFYEKSLEIKEKLFVSNRLNLTSTYNNIGLVYLNIGQHEKTIQFCRKALEIQEAFLPSYHPDLAKTYRCIAMAYDQAGKFSESLQQYEKIIDIQKKSLPPNHPDLAASYNTLGEVYRNMGDYEKALLHCQQALDMKEKSLPATDIELASTYTAMGNIYSQLGDFVKALANYEKAMEIQQKSFPPNHPDIGASYMNMGNIYCCQCDYVKAILCYRKALEIQEKTLPSNHQDLISCYYNIGELSHRLGEYPAALSVLEQGLTHLDTGTDIHKTITHAFLYLCLGKVYQSMKDYEKALDFYQKVIVIREQVLPSNHPDLAIAYSSIGDLYRLLAELNISLSFHQKALDIQEKVPSNQLNIATTYYHMGETLQAMLDYSSALSYYKKALEIRQKLLPKDHADVISIQKSLSQTYSAIGEHHLASE